LCVFVSLWSPPLLASGIFEYRNLFLLELGRDADEQGEGGREGGRERHCACSCAYMLCLVHVVLVLVFGTDREEWAARIRTRGRTRKRIGIYFVCVIEAFIHSRQADFAHCSSSH